MGENRIERFYSLDVLRGVAALGVVLWHWAHFFMIGSQPGPYHASQMPLYSLAFIFYDKGWLGVDLFFSLSGFIFFWLYSARIAEGSITAGRFAWLRFSRLYPLHLVTLLVVIVELALAGKTGALSIYSNNDLKHFLLNLFLAPSWGFEDGASFNGPIWSVSVEVFLYGLFFLFCRVIPARLPFLLLLSLSGYHLLQPLYSPLGRGISSFFLGGATYVIYCQIAKSERLRYFTIWAILCTVMAWAVTLGLFAANIDLVTVFRDSIHIRKNMGHLTTPWPTMVLFPMTILSLALAETCRGALGKRIAYIGDISYSCYLIHYPLQFAFLLAFSYFGVQRTICSSGWFMGLFFALLIPLCLMSYHFLELPAQAVLRQIRRPVKLTQPA